MVDVGWLGSPIDVATFLFVLYGLRHEIKPRVSTLAAGVVALAEQEPHVDDDRLQDELDVEDRQVAALRPKVLKRGEHSD